MGDKLFCLAGQTFKGFLFLVLWHLILNLRPAMLDIGQLGLQIPRPEWLGRQTQDHQ